MTEKDSYMWLHNSLLSAMPLVSLFLYSSKVVHIALVNKGGLIQQINQNLAKCLKVDAVDSVGKNICSFLTTPDGESLAGLLAAQDASCSEELLLNVVDSHQVPHSLRFRLAGIEGGFLLLGEPLLEENQTLQEELLQLNNQLSALSRENVRKGRDLDQRARELEEANRKIFDLAFLDPLTGIANRRCLDTTLAREAERVSRLGLPLTVIMVDVDHFKKVNDSFGHAMGDRVLQAVAAALAGLLRPYDMVSRFGGEEFLIMMPGTCLKDGMVAAERFRVALSTLAIDGLCQRITASFGVATLLRGQPLEALVERADMAMYRAKDKGRNRVESAEEDEGDEV